MVTVKTIDEINEMIDKNDMLLIYFGSSSCGVCISVLPKLETMLKEYPNIKAVKVEIQNSMKLSAMYNVFTIPVIMLYIQGKETVREARIFGMEDLQQKISRYYKLFYGDN